VQQSATAENAHERALLRGVLDAIEECSPASGSEILEDIKQYLRARNAKEITVNGSKAVAIEHARSDEVESVQSLNDSE
jgi:hypothetical protein